MSKHFKLLTILLSVILCFSAFSLTALAVDADGDGYDDITGEYIGGGSGVSGGDTPVYTDPYVEPDPVNTDPYVEPDPAVTDPYVEPDPVATEPAYEEPGDSYSSSGNGNSGDYYIGDEPSYLGGGQSYVAPESTAPSVPLKNANENIDVNELSSNDWKDISANLKNASTQSDGDDFSFIQKNNSSGDNGYLILISGVLLIVLSLAGITYFIASGASRRKKLAAAGAGGGRGGNYSGGNRYRASDDYDDGYRVSRKEEKKKAKHSERYDTADIRLPKKNNSKNRYR